LAGIPIPVFIARGCSFDSCNCTGTWFGAGYFGGGEAACFSQTVHHEGCFDQCGLIDGINFGSAPFELCSFRDVRLRKLLCFHQSLSIAYLRVICQKLPS
jgi:hypothetical protein